MRQLRFSRLAESDIEQIGDYIARGNPARAITFIAELRARSRLIVDFPFAARERPELGDGVRVAVFGRYLIVYAVGPDYLEVLRIVHGARVLRTRPSR